MQRSAERRKDCLLHCLRAPLANCTPLCLPSPLSPSRSILPFSVSGLSAGQSAWCRVADKKRWGPAASRTRNEIEWNDGMNEMNQLKRRNGEVREWTPAQPMGNRAEVRAIATVFTFDTEERIYSIKSRNDLFKFQNLFVNFYKHELKAIAVFGMDWADWDFAKSLISSRGRNSRSRSPTGIVFVLRSSLEHQTAIKIIRSLAGGRHVREQIGDIANQQEDCQKQGTHCQPIWIA